METWSRQQKEIDWLIKEKYQGRTDKNLKQDIVRLKKGEPIDFIIGFVDFLGCWIDLSLRPLIPRPETEFWTDVSLKAIKEIEDCPSRIDILDIFAGSGCIGIAVLKKIKNARVDFSDINEKCLRQIKINLALNKIHKKRWRIIKSDVFQGIKRKYDFILANPPYIALRRKDKIQKSVLRFESGKYLFAGADGLLCIRKFLKGAPAHLKENGKIYLEIDSCQKKAVEKLLVKLRYKDYEIHRDQFGKWRFVIIKG